MHAAETFRDHTISGFFATMVSNNKNKCCIMDKMLRTLLFPIFALFGTVSAHENYPANWDFGQEFLPITDLLPGNRGPGERGWVINGNVNVRLSGDNNSDGFSDLGLTQSNGENSASSQVVLLRGQGLSRGIVDALESNPESTVIVLNSALIDLNVHAIGDHNGDGVDDFVVSGRPEGGIGSTESNLYVVYGNSTLPDPVDVADLNGSNGYVVNLGFDDSHRVVNVGDRNNDGINEIGVFRSREYSSLAFDPPEIVFEEALFILFGSEENKPPLIDITELDPSIGSSVFIFEEFDANCVCVSDIFAGDFDADGRTDVAINSFPSIGASDKAEIYLNRGDTDELLSIEGDTITRQWLGSSDLNNDGHPDLTLLADPSNSNDEYFVVFGGPNLANRQAISIADIISDLGTQLMDSDWAHAKEIGDINGDGITDFVRNPNFGDTWEIIYGRAQGYVSRSGVDPINPLDKRITDSEPTPVGDINGDGLADLAFKFDASTTIIQFGQRTSAIPVTSIADTSGNGIPEIAQLKLGDPSGIRLFVSDVQTGVRTNNVRFFNDAWMPRQVHSVTINSEPAAGDASAT